MTNMHPGPRNLITDIDGILVGNADASTALSGSTVVLMQEPFVTAVDMRGGGPATRETDLLRPECMVEKVDAISFSGGSVYGLAAGDGVVKYLAEQGRGFEVGPWRSPIVPGACINDIVFAGGGEIMRDPPYQALGYQAAANAARDFTLGNVGAGIGATAQRLKGGLGSASVFAEDGIQVGAIVIVNPFGSAVMPGSTALWSWPFERNSEFGGARPTGGEPPASLDFPYEVLDQVNDDLVGGNTTLAVIATNARLDRSQAARVSIMSHDGYARAIRPIHTNADGDAIFTVATGARTMDTSPIDLARVGAMAADCVARAIARAVYEAEDLGGITSYRSRYQLK